MFFYIIDLSIHRKSRHYGEEAMSFILIYRFKMVDF